MFLTASTFAQTGAKYLAIAHDNFINAVKPLVEWKTKKGIPAVCVPLSVTGSSSTQIKTYIQNAYNTWNPRPEYVLLVGSPDLLPAYSSGYNYYDGYYADMSGDYEMEICIGRFHCATLAQCSLMVAKTIGYEKSETMHDSAWFSKGTTIVGEDEPPDPYYQADTRYIRNFWRGSGYFRTDSFISTQGNNANDVINAINDGRAFVVYRGQSVSYWWGQFDVDPNLTNNGYKLPIVVSGTCATMTLTPGEQMLGDDFLRAGTVQNPKGAVGFFGTAFVGSHISLYRGTVAKGFFQALYQDGIYTMGGAAKRGKFILDSLYHIQDRYLEWNLLGDPELNVWTAKPRLLDVSYDTILFLWPANLPVQVYSSGIPVANAYVCVMMDSTVYTTGITDNSGLVTLSFTPQHTGTLQVTVTGHNFFPFEDSALVISSGSYVVHLRHSIDDVAGNGDGIVNPGENIEMPTWVKNLGNEPAENVSGRLTTTSPNVALTDTLKSFGTVGAGDSSFTGADGYNFVVAPSCTNGYRIPLKLVCHDQYDSTWQSNINILVGTSILNYADKVIYDPGPGGNNNHRLDPGEAGELVIVLRNTGIGNGYNVTAKLRSGDTRLTVIDSIGNFGTINHDTTGNNQNDRFTVIAANAIPQSTPIRCTLHITADGDYTKTSEFELIIGEMRTIDPIPDGPRTPPLYYAYEDLDTIYVEHPHYEWIEIKTVGTRLGLGDNQTIPVTLPGEYGPWKFYDQRYTQISISSNGWIAPGVQTRSAYRNRPIPDTTSTNPNGMVCADWDDLIPSFSGVGGIYYYHDATNHRFVIEYDSIPYKDTLPTEQTDKFEIIIYDTTMAAADGHNEIFVNYLTSNRWNSSTVGLEDPTDYIGIQCLFNDTLNRACAPWTPRKVIKYTTDTMAIGLTEALANLNQSKPALHLLSNPSHQIARLKFQISEKSKVSLSVFDISGRFICRIFDSKEQSLGPGIYTIRWNGKDNTGRKVASGIYFYRLKTDGFDLTKKSVFFK